MATYDDLERDRQMRENLRDDMKSNGVDIALPHEDFDSGWIQLTRGLSVTINHNLGVHPRLMALYSNVQAGFTNSCIYEVGSDPDVSLSVINVSPTSVTVVNDSKSTSFKFFNLKLWI